VVKQFEEREEIWGMKEWWVSNKKPRLRAVEEGRIGVEERKREGWGDFRELDRSANKHEFSLGWVKREKVRRHPVGNVREERTEIVGCRDEGIRRRRERYVKLSVISIEVVVVSARE
jgi:hypothetical protein